MTNRAIREQRRYETSIDRAGLSLGAGSALAGCIVAALVAAGGQADPLALLSAWAIGTVFSGLAITALGAPLWLMMHVAGLRRAHHAALIGAGIAMAVFVAAQTYGFGMLDVAPLDGRTRLFRWISAILSSGLLALAAGAIGAVMWRIAYRERREP